MVARLRRLYVAYAYSHMAYDFSLTDSVQHTENAENEETSKAMRNTIQPDRKQFSYFSSNTL